MGDLDVQALTLLEAVVLLALNGLGATLTLLAWRVSDVDVHEARIWEPPTPDPVEVLRLKHNRLVVTQDDRYGERGRFLAHGCAAVLAVVWLVTPQPVNPDVIYWAVVARIAAIALSVILIDKTSHHLVSRWRFNKPWATTDRRFVHLWPALKLAWADMRALVPSQERNR